MLGKAALIATILLFATASAWAAPAQVLMIRHAEKPSSGNDLSPAGYARAKALVAYFEKTPTVTTYGTPAAIYAMGYGSEDSSHRAIETVTPLAQALGLSILDQYQEEDIKPLVNEILTTPAYDGKMVLLCWEHNMIPQIAQAFGENNMPDTWDSDDFWSVWELNFSGETVSSFQIFSQNLMPGDPANPSNSF